MVLACDFGLSFLAGGFAAWRRSHLWNLRNLWMPFI
jgi:hypothetical protein